MDRGETRSSTESEKDKKTNEDRGPGLENGNPGLSSEMETEGKEETPVREAGRNLDRDRDAGDRQEGEDTHNEGSWGEKTRLGALLQPSVGRSVRKKAGDTEAIESAWPTSSSGIPSP